MVYCLHLADLYGKLGELIPWVNLGSTDSDQPGHSVGPQMVVS